MAHRNLVIVGRIGRPHGVRGWAHVQSFTLPPENLARYGNWLLEAADGWREARVAELKPHGDAFVARFEGVDDRDAAAALTGWQLAVPRAALPEPDADEYYWHDLEGLSVWDQTGRRLGAVDHLIGNGAGDSGASVLVVRDGERETLIPFAAGYVERVDLEAQRIDVRWEAAD